MTTQHEHQHRQAVLGIIDLLAKDVGRLRRHSACEGSLEHLADRLAHAVQGIYWMHAPCAHDLILDGADVNQALDIVDAWQAQLEKTLGENSIRDLRADAQPTELAA